MNQPKELELKHLCAYLPYGLKIQTYSSIAELTYLLDIKIGFVSIWNVLRLDYYKPILRPLSNFYININGKGSMAEQTWNIANIEINNDLEILTNELGKYLPAMDVYNTLQVLFANHFDVYNLIPAGLAIDVNTVK